MSIIVASISGGKDSSAMSLYLAEKGIDHRRIFADTGWEHPSTYEHLDYLETVLGPIDRIKSDCGGFEALVRRKGLFPSRIMRFCTQQLKILPIQRRLAVISEETGSDIVNAIGIRSGESAARSKLPEREFDEFTGVEVWRPILNWSVQNVIDIHRRYGIRMHPLYRNGLTRVGCWPCIFSMKNELRIFSKIDPDKVSFIANLEQELSTGKDAPRSMFWLRDGAGKHHPSAIHDVLEWAGQDRGTLLLDLPPQDWVCASMGYCEVEP